MYSDRINSLPPYLFARIDEAKAMMIAKGKDVIDLGIGDPDLPTPNHIVQSMIQAVQDPKTHKYPSYTGMLEFRKAVSNWCKKIKGFEVNPISEVLTLIGAKEGVAHLPLAFINPKDIALIPNPGYPVYEIATKFAGGIPHIMPLVKENDFLPELEVIPKEIRNKAKLMFLNYPNNPTSATATIGFFKEVVDFGHEHEIIIVHDNPYSEMVYGDYQSPSFLNVKGAIDIGIELFSLSKTYNMTGWRIAMAVGNEKIIQGLGKIKSNIDSGTFNAIQMAGITALSESQKCVSDVNAIYSKRRDVLIKGLKDIGLNVDAPKATFYIWVKIPDRYNSMEFSKLILEEFGIVATPGIGFGEHGEGYIRFALTQPVERIEEAVSRLSKLKV